MLALLKIIIGLLFVMVVFTLIDTTDKKLGGRW